MTPSIEEIRVSSLVLYRGRPARVTQVGERLELELEDGVRARVREKDVEFIHPGPLASLRDLIPLPGEMRAAWEILAGGKTTLGELAELAFGKFTPAAAWAAWLFVAEGRFFSGSPRDIHALSVEEVERKQHERERQEAEERAWHGFIERAGRGQVLEEDKRYLRELEPLAFGNATRARALRELGRGETPENAHALLLDCGFWTVETNPYPQRLGMPLFAPDLPIPELPDEPRRDLTDLAAYAIDDTGTDNPDDALSLDGERVWVHVADPAALAPVGSALDREARERGMTLHLPEQVIHYFPYALIRALGLGLQNKSPALSFGMDLDETGGIRSVEIVPSWTRVERLSYEEALEQMDSEPFAKLERLMTKRRQRRVQSGAVGISLPEVKIKVEGGKIDIHPIRPLRSRLLVEEAMILAGEAAARFALEHDIPLPFSTQEAPVENILHTTLAGMFAMRRQLKKSQHRTIPAPHAGLGIDAYAQATSPLRRSMDLAVHQQLRAFLRGEPLQSESDLIERIGAMEAVAPALRQAEMYSVRHWTLVYLQRNNEWRGEAVVVDKRGSQATVILPELALETRLHLKGEVALDTVFPVRVVGVDLPTLDLHLATV
jgi:exoribonuclease-2